MQLVHLLPINWDATVQRAFINLIRGVYILCFILRFIRLDLCTRLIINLKNIPIKSQTVLRVVVFWSNKLNVIAFPQFETECRVLEYIFNEFN